MRKMTRPEPVTIEKQQENLHNATTRQITNYLCTPNMYYTHIVVFLADRASVRRLAGRASFVQFCQFKRYSHGNIGHAW